MPIDLQAVLPVLLPRAIEWVKGQSDYVLESGSPLNEAGIAVARAVGVAKPEKIRVSVVSKLPIPDDPELQQVALETGLLGPEMVGVTFGYAIYLCEGRLSNRLLSHECRHVYQYEVAGSIEAFLPVYLHQIATVGYHDAPLEVDARQHEIDSASLAARRSGDMLSRSTL